MFMCPHSFVQYSCVYVLPAVSLKLAVLEKFSLCCFFFFVFMSLSPAAVRAVCSGPRLHTEK